jgi:hypothetical protein
VGGGGDCFYGSNVYKRCGKLLKLMPTTNISDAITKIL